MSVIVPKACVIGWPVDHSLSPLVHRHWLRRHRIEGEYDRRPVPPEEVERFLRSFADQGLVGCTVTLPHKEAAFRLAGRASSLAQQLGAANTLWLEDGELIADNTDVHGFTANLDAAATRCLPVAMVRWGPRHQPCRCPAGRFERQAGAGRTDRQHNLRRHGRCACA